MNINSVNVIFFSPTETTKRVVEGIARGIRVDSINQNDLTPPEARTLEFAEMRDELAIIGAPVYAGRIPQVAVRRLRRLKACHAPAVIVVVYGNREYEDALLELKDIVVEAGFMPIAGGAFIGENTANYALDKDTAKIAQGRPDTEDLKKALAFGRLVWNKVRDIGVLDAISPLQVPGNFPYIDRGKLPRTSPATKETLCAKCEECARVCPTAAIVVRDEVMTDQDACIMCCACVKHCSTGARVCDHTWMKQAGKWLSANYRERKEPEIYV
jgi:ferredoxin